MPGPEPIEGRVPGVSPGVLGLVEGRAKSTVPGRLPGDKPPEGRAPPAGPLGRAPTDGRETPPAGRDGAEGLLNDGERPTEGEGRETARSQDDPNAASFAA